MIEITNKSLQKIDERQTKLTNNITDLLQMLCKAVKEVRVEVDYRLQLFDSQDLAGPSKERPSDVSIPIPPIKTQVVGEAHNLGTTKLNAMAKSLGHVTIDFSTLPMYEVYAIRNVAVIEMKVREGKLVKKVRASNNTINKMKKIVKETERKSKTWEEDMHRLQKCCNNCLHQFFR